MHRTAKCIKMLFILNSKDEYITVTELAELLETNPRNVREYKKELVKAGFQIDSKPSHDGGYKLSKGTLCKELSDYTLFNAYKDNIHYLKENKLLKEKTQNERWHYLYINDSNFPDHDETVIVAFMMNRSYYYSLIKWTGETRLPNGCKIIAWKRFQKAF